MGAALLAGVAAPAALAVPNGAPVPGRDLIEAVEDGGAVTGNVLANDTDPEGDPLTVASVHAPSATVGTLTVAANGDYSFTPALDYHGSGLAWYFVSDGHGHTGIVYVDITVSLVNDPPEAADYTFGATEDTNKTLTASQLLAGVTDVDLDVPTVSGVANADGGTVGWASNTATFTPDADVCGDASGGFEYTVSDGHGGTDTGYVELDIACTNDAPVAGADSFSDAVEDTDWTLDAADLLTNDDDIDGDSLDVAAVGTPDHGSVDLQAGTITFSPDADFDGTGTFEYTVTDHNGGTDTGTVSVGFAGTNDAPVAVDDTGEIAAYDAGEDFDVAGNDEDIDGDTLAAVDASVDPAAGVATISGGQVHFVPTDGYTGAAVITYTVSDGDLTDEGTLTLDVLPDAIDPVPAAPTVTFGAGRVNESAPLLISWSATDGGSGVATYEVQVSVAGGPFTAVYAGSATHVTKLYPFAKTLVWRVRATDLASNTSDWVSSAARSLAAYQGGSPVTRTGTWTSVATNSASGTGYRYTTTSGNKVSLSFTGREVLFVGTKGSRAGAVRVYVDGVRQGTYSEWASASQYGRIIAKKAWGASGSHRVTTVAAQGVKRTTFDAFIVLR